MTSPRTGSGQHAAGRRRVRTTLACALALVTLAACTGPGHDPEPLDDWESPGASRPEQRGNTGDGLEGDPDGPAETGDVPPAEPIPDDHGALEVVREWVRAETTAYRGGNRDRLRDLATANCKPCDRALDSIAEVYADDGRLRDRYTQTISFIQGVTGTNPPVVQTVIDRSARVLLDQKGAVRKRIPASQEILEFRTAKEGSTWLVDDIISVGR